jgi:hypothetical protein
MKLSRSEIDEEADRILEGDQRSKMTPYKRAVLIATLEYFNDVPIDQFCPACKGIVSVEAFDQAWILSCPCGRTKDTLRGL